jgi:hypothetical protein
VTARYTVRRRNWHPTGDGYVRLPGDAFVAGFDDPADAARLAERLEAAARSRIANPFRCGRRWADLSTLPEFALADWLLDAGLSPPSARTDGTRNWTAWWDDRSKFWTAAQVARVYDGLDRLRFYDVVARPPDRTAFVAVEPLWRQATERDPSFRYDDLERDAYHAGGDGGRPVRAFGRAEDAAAFAELVAEQVAATYRWWHDGSGFYVPAWWVAGPDAAADWLAETAVPWSGVPACRIEEAEFDPSGGPPLRDEVFAVCWLGWRTRYGASTHRSFGVRPGGSRDERRVVPAVVCTRRETADGRAAELTRATRGEFNPFELRRPRPGWRLPPGAIERNDEFDAFPEDAWIDWPRWWDRNAPAWPPDVFHAAWDAVGPPLVEVMPVPFDG